jgi:predicted nucleic acid-binding protein
MSVGIVDTTVILHYFRNIANARTWVDSQAVRLSVTSVTWMEVMEGASNKANQAQCKGILSQFDLIYLTAVDPDWAMRQMENYRLSHGVTTEGCLIASVAYRLQLPCTRTI